MINVKNLVSSVCKDITTHWKRPAQGNFVSYKELINLALGGMGNQLTMQLVWQMGLSAGNTLLGSTIGIRPLHLQYMLTFQTILNVLFFFVRAHIVDNTRTKWGRFRPYIAFAGIPVAVLAVVFVFLPFQTMSYNEKLISVFAFAITISMVQPLFTDTYSELQTVITPNSEERAKVISINSIIYSFAPTLTGLFIPILSNLTGGYTNINTYRYVLAPISLLGLGLNFFTAIGCKERVVASSTYVQKVGIIEGAFMILKNKHWWIRQIASLIGFLEGATGVFFSWIYIYSVQDMTAYGLLNTVMGTASGIAMAITPFLLKKLGNKKLLVYHNLLNVVFCFILIFTFKSPVIMFIIMYLNGLVNALSLVYNTVMHSEVKDYQQYICGYRMDFVFGLAGMITMPISLLSGYVIPYVYECFGLTTNYDILYDPHVRNSLFLVLCILAIVGAVLNLIPFCFYSMSKEKHQNIIRVLRYRALFDDFESGDFNADIIKNGVEAVRGGLELNNSPVPDLRKLKADIKGLKGEPKQIAKKEYLNAKSFAADQAEVGIFMEEYNKFDTPVWQHKVDSARKLIANDVTALADIDESIIAHARKMPKSNKDERILRKYYIVQAKAIVKTGRLIKKNYPNGIAKPDEEKLKAAYEMPDNTRAENKIKNARIKAVEGEFDLYYKTIAPYAAAQKLVHSYENRDKVMEWAESHYDEACEIIRLREDEEERKKALQKKSFAGRRNK
ncbi:MAG: MFS transporter [Eubacterium sp.]|nr:MFS transporter [Eubacterium sp.]